MRDRHVPRLERADTAEHETTADDSEGRQPERTLVVARVCVHVECRQRCDPAKAKVTDASRPGSASSVFTVRISAPRFDRIPRVTSAAVELSGQQKGNVSGAAGQVEDLVVGMHVGHRHKLSFPALVLAVGQQRRYQIVPRRDGRKHLVDVVLLLPR